MLWLSCEGQIDVWELLSDISHLSAILDRQGLLVAAPVDLRTKKPEGVSPQLLLGFRFKLKRKNPKIVVIQAKSSALATIPFVLGRGRGPNPWWQASPYLGTRMRNNFVVVEEGTILSEEVPLPMDPLARKEHQMDFSQSRQSVRTIGIKTSIA